MVDPVARISATSASAATMTESSLSIAEPDNAWADARQSHINADLAALKKKRDEGDEGGNEDVPDTLDDRHPHKRQDAVAAVDTDEEQPEDRRLSGESERIGTRNFDDDTPFGLRVIII
ncbi:hypothetical protein [Aliirhizobium smilacinae]|uniref:Uncharacterized protein n=1 Tax=Aliirhizobium smilacinae TaxID=1395944 RepID=A0A5C4XGN2_9HYPH|nr:hypothetical protein [Rhizobium smilacinae]TNM62685.1 hypothetical protein FHP24_15755 [Rhizobium smilacinae]